MAGYALRALPFVATLSVAAVLSRQGQPSVLCDGSRFPDVDACELIVAGLGWTSNPSGTTAIPDGSDCLTVNDRQHTANCQIVVCNNIAGSPAISNSEANDNYNAVSNTCIIGQEAGGASNSADGRYQVQAWNDPLYNPGGKQTRGLGLEMNGVTWAELEQMQKRQQSGDNGATLNIVTNNVEAPNSRQAVTGRLPAGSSYTTTETDTRSTGIESSFGLEAGFFDLFTASASLTVSTDYSVSSTTGTTVLIQCEDGQQGVLNWSPLFNRYQGNFQPSGDAYDVYIPLQESAGSYDVECLG